MVGRGHHNGEDMPTVFEQSCVLPSRFMAIQMLQRAGGVPTTPPTPALYRLERHAGLDGNGPCKPSAWKARLKKVFPKWALEEWLKLVKAHPKLRLYRKYKKDLDPPFFAFLPNFQGRDTLVQAR